MDTNSENIPEQNVSNTASEQQVIPENTEEITEPILTKEEELMIEKQEWGRLYGAIKRSLSKDDVQLLENRLKTLNLTPKEYILKLVNDDLHPPPMSLQQIADALDQAIQIKQKLDEVNKVLGIRPYIDKELLEDLTKEEKKESPFGDLMSEIMPLIREQIKETVKAQVQKQLKSKKKSKDKV
jgi:formate-dependent nitrite reductase cytochrome c552 subunit